MCKRNGIHAVESRKSGMSRGWISRMVNTLVGGTNWWCRIAITDELVHHGMEHTQDAKGEPRKFVPGSSMAVA